MAKKPRKIRGEVFLELPARVDEWIEEIAGGMNFKRKKFLDLVERIIKGEINRLLIAHKDRLMRFGFDLVVSTPSQAVAVQQKKCAYPMTRNKKNMNTQTVSSGKSTKTF